MDEESSMGPPENELPIWSKDVDGAREEIFQFLRYESNMKVIYVDGWDGFGASAILRSIAEVLPSRRTTAELCFDRIIYVDCSEWKNRRAVQRTIAEELQLDHSVMAILDEQDEEDDFNRVDESSRNEIRNVGKVINQTLRGTKLMMIFLNGSDEEVDISTFGIPLAIFDNNIIIWTFSRRNHVHSKDALRYTHAFSHFYHSIKEFSWREFLRLLYQQAVAIVARNPFVPEIDPTMVADCCLYELFLHYNFHTVTEFNWVGHASNFWICDAIIQGDRAMDISNLLHREINWVCDSSLPDGVLEEFMGDFVTPFWLVTDDHAYEEGPYRWISLTSSKMDLRTILMRKEQSNMEIQGLRTIPVETSSFFLAFESSSQQRGLPDGLFECANKLGVLILSCCAFDFASPPFQKCQSLRFLGLDHCTNSKSGEGEDNAEWTYICNVLVLDLRYTEWNEILCEEKMDLMTNMIELNIEGVWCQQYIGNLQGRLPNLQRLRITKPRYKWKPSEDFDNSFVDKTSMKILDLSGNSEMEILPASISKASSLQLLVLDGCNGLESVGGLPSSLESFSFNGYGPASQWTQTVALPPEQFRPSTIEDFNMDIRVSEISLAGCTQLKNLFLCWLPNLVELDLSGIAIKIFDLNTMVVQVPKLKRVFLIGCTRLRAIIPMHESGSEIKQELELLCIDTRVGTVSSRPSINMTKSFKFELHVVAADARLTRSVKGLLLPYVQKGIMKDVSYNIHVTSSPVHDGVVQFEATSKNKVDPSEGDQGSLQQLIPAGPYSDVLSMLGNPQMEDFPQPPTNTKRDHHIEIAKGSCYVESELLGDLGYLVGTSAESLHVHDVSMRAIALYEFYQFALKWCCVERCPELDVVFPSVSTGFNVLETFWASDLLTARWIWGKATYKGFFSHTANTFPNLQHLHLRSCPRLQFVVPLYGLSFPSLKTLHIIHCGDLVHVFELNMDYPEKITALSARLPKLTTIHLHDLPKLENICEVKMVAPMLESIKIRGCWSLRRLPSVGARGQGEKKPAVEVEKDVWNTMEWDDDHRPDHFEAPVHSRYYKEKLPRASVLR
ncbi:unnamed protein product [Triticum turgidum subsp. durum]|uniref:NB-ARC domain-containing protein n=1 Tax=Triticum turgidum subsp. durum TaxID=4567 RepID=A0A9R1Q5X6_TRITD|nr:unnamed protein product [Triticum turgidum subsp. durum]